MKGPDKIYFHKGSLGSPCASYEKTTENDEEYLHKDTLLEWATEHLTDISEARAVGGGNKEYNDGLELGFKLLVRKLTTL